ncbi:MAG: AAA family ATPase [Bacteroidetes bacterium GWF2_42_66]|nr:MAG: AAA family ATPase [Bacteroidetes bacterium GWA2_42_15]OFY02153.1 MAG: AAA family ATPase [Bacteroidetes bacterium GWE2_42_39]OFY43599.1 MAG: AAA family ATPase [Bacteroidetes bacterium GWF2_42_66]HBL75229.1 AAA family ATPase [Prolixibacteraceae bacterium]HCU59689.1 AAA family ATPase [Prolixibacteraceae bacterium]
MRTVEIFCENNGQKKEYPLGVTLEEIKDDLQIKLDYPICGALVNHKIKELSFAVVKSKNIRFIDYSHPDGVRLYVRSVLFVLYAAVKEVFPSVRLKIMHGISNGFYCELEGMEQTITESDIFALKSEMDQLIAKDIPFEKRGIPTSEAVEILQTHGLYNKARLFSQQGTLFSYLNFLGPHVNYFFGHLLPSTGYIRNYGLVAHYDGILVRVPKQNDFTKLRKVFMQDKLFGIFQEHKDWAEILNVSNIGNLNSFGEEGRSGDILKISEALHEKKVAEIANMISERKDRVKIILIAGPSASGKTTFSKRLSVQLAVNGIHPYMISLDDYFVDREKTPLDEYGEYDFESLQAIDVEYFNQQLLDLFEGKEVELSRFDFNLGRRTHSGKKLKMDSADMLIVEGIHGMNPNLVPHIKAENTFKIFLSALTQISFDDHNYIPTTDNRLIRRMIRDAKYRGYSAADTIRRWPSVRKGEDKNIFPYQENADIMFNSALIYELAVLKKYAEPLLKSVPECMPEYSETNRLLKFMSYFHAIDESEIPPTSVIREFLGGSSFNY